VRGRLQTLELCALPQDGEGGSGGSGGGDRAMGVFGLRHMEGAGAAKRSADDGNGS
jgi:hypothetical protein